MYHIVILLLAENLTVALHKTIETSTQEMHVLRVHHMAEGILIFSPNNTPLHHGTGIIAHCVERR